VSFEHFPQKVQQTSQMMRAPHQLLQMKIEIMPLLLQWQLLQPRKLQLQQLKQRPKLFDWLVMGATLRKKGLQLLFNHTIGVI
jgi:hypothetical protein